MNALRTRTLLPAAVAAVLTLTGCGGDSRSDSSGDAAGGGGAKSSSAPVEAADDPAETVRRLAPLAKAADWEQACLLMAEDEATPYASYPDLLEECVRDHAPEQLAAVPGEAWDEILSTPEERIETGENGVGRPQLTYNDSSAERLASIEFYVGDNDGRYYFKSLSVS